MRFFSLAMTILVLTLSNGQVWAQARPAQVVVDAVVIEDLTETVPVIGRVVARQQGEVAARVEGAIEQVLVEVGDRVDAGDLLATIDATRLRLSRDIAKSELVAAEAELQSSERQVSLLQQELERIERLRSSAAFSRASFDDKTKEIAVEEAKREATRARREMAAVELEKRRTDVEDTTILAPYPGVIVQRYGSAGAYVRVGDPIVEMINDGNLEIEADIPADRIAGLTEGLEIDVTLETGDAIRAMFRAVVPLENALTRTRAVRFVPAAADGGRQVDTAGESVTVAIPIGAANAVVTVHKDAVTVSQGQRMVFLVDGDKVRPQPINVGRSIGGRFEIVDDSLKSGDLVVVRGNERLRPGQVIQYEGMPEFEEDKPATSEAPGGSKTKSSSPDDNRAGLRLMPDGRRA